MRETSLADWLSALAAFFSAVAAGIALMILQQERPTPYKVALYSTQWEAIREYSKASAEFQSALKVVHRDVPLDVDKPELLANTSDRILFIAATGARPILQAWENYIAAESAASAVFSLEAHQSFEIAEKVGRSAKTCYELLGWRVDYVEHDPNWWAGVRQRAAQPCKGVHSSQAPKAFATAANIVLRAITDEARHGTSQLVPGELQKPLE